MPTIIDSLFLELGIDTAKFSTDQRKALDKIAEFEKKATKSGKNAGAAIKTVGDAFKDLTRDTRIGATGAGIDQLGQKLTALGKSAQVAGVASGSVAEGLGMLLSPTALGIAAVGLLGVEMWDLNKKMTATNATIYRQAQLSGMNAANLWDWGEAARTVGANPQDITGGIAALQTQIMGMGIGAANATPQLVALARLGVPFNFRTGVPIEKLMARVHEMAMKDPDNLGALRALTGPVMNDAMFNIATNPDQDPVKLMEEIKKKQAVDTGSILRKSLESQTVLGKLGIAKDIMAETAYGGEQGLMQAVVTLLTSILDGVNQLVEWIVHPVEATKKAASAVVDTAYRVMEGVVDGVKNLVSMPPTTGSGISRGMQVLKEMGVSDSVAAAIIGNAAQESSMNPLAINSQGNRGLFQLDKSRQANFAKMFGYSIGSDAVSADQQFRDQLKFAMQEPEFKAAMVGMAKARTLMGKTGAFMNLDEKPGDGSLGKRFAFAQQAMRLADVAGMSSNRSSITMTNDTRIGEINVHTTSDNPAAHADGVRKGLTTHPLISPVAQGTVALATRGMAQ